MFKYVRLFQEKKGNFSILFVVKKRVVLRNATIFDVVLVYYLFAVKIYPRLLEFVSLVCSVSAHQEKPARLRLLCKMCSEDCKLPLNNDHSSLSVILHDPTCRGEIVLVGPLNNDHFLFKWS